METADVVEAILSHHGVLGMKWGVRRASGTRSVTITDKRKRIKTSGGEGHPAHPDAIRTAKIGRVGRKSGLKALSDEQLQTYTKRLNLEQNAKRLDFETSSVGRKFVKTLMRDTGRKVHEEAATSSAKMVAKGLRRAATAAAAAA